jgi:hypothetical protein
MVALILLPSRQLRLPLAMMNRYFTPLLTMSVLSIVLAGLSGCGGGSGSAASTNQAAESPASGSSGNDGTSASSGSLFASFMGRDKLLIGAQMDDTTAASAPFDAR